MISQVTWFSLIILLFIVKGFRFSYFGRVVVCWRLGSSGCGLIFIGIRFLLEVCLFSYPGFVLGPGLGGIRWGIVLLTVFLEIIIFAPVFWCIYLLITQGSLFSVISFMPNHASLYKHPSIYRSILPNSPVHFPIHQSIWLVYFNFASKYQFSPKFPIFILSEPFSKHQCFLLTKYFIFIKLKLYIKTLIH